MFANKFTTGCILLVLAFQAPPARAQNGLSERPNRAYRPVPPLPPEFEFAYHHASTAAEGWLRGQAQVIHAAGGYWLSLTQALICREEARRLALENRRQWVEYRIALRTRREWDRHSRLAELRSKNAALHQAKYEAYRLKPSQLNRATGVLAWPEALRAAEYDDLRGHLDELFRIQAGLAGPYGDRAAEITRCTRTLMDEVRRNRTSMMPTDFLAAEKFLCGVKHEAEFPPVDAGTDNPRTTSSVQFLDPSKTLKGLN